MAGLFHNDMKFFPILVVAFLANVLAFSQETEQTQNVFGKEQLREFAWKKDSLYRLRNGHMRKMASKYHLELTERYGEGGLAVLQFFEKGKPVYFITNNVDAASTISADLLWADYSEEYLLNGNNIEVGLWDAGSVFQEHQEFVASPEKIWQRDKPNIVLNHSTHIAGTIKAQGIEPNSKGMAPEAKLLAYDFNNGISEMAVAASENLLLSNHSYGKICGWSYNSSNENWFWYGDTSLNQQEDLDFGYYDSICWDVDYIVFNAPNYLIVKSAGNDRGEGPVDQPVRHYEWNDGWITSEDIHDLDGGESGYRTVCSMAAAKNALVIGAVEDLPEGYVNSESVLVETYSAWGPTSDGRIKPDVMANGSDVYSCTAAGNDVYDSYSGTSMSAANATGAIALLLQLQQQLQPAVYLWSSTIKALLIQSADECGTSDGPDYSYGYGLINAYHAASLLKSNILSGGEIIRQDIVQKGESKEIQLEVDENCNQLKVTLCWTDPPGIVCDQTKGETFSALVNDIDLTIEDQLGNVYLPWVLNSDQPDLPASKGENHTDNVEQVVLLNPTPGIYKVKVNGAGIDSEGGQCYSIVSEGHVISDGIAPPNNLSYQILESGIELSWREPDNSPAYYNIYMNEVCQSTCEDTSYIINELELDEVYTFYITANYQSDEIKESLPSNTIEVRLVEQSLTPYYTSFDEGKDGWVIKEDGTGWRWGNRDSLTSYYLHFENNSTPFLWIDSGIMSHSTHVNDIAISKPIDLSGKENISLSFDYVLMTDRYDVIDDLFVVCRRESDSEWTVISELSQSSDWRFYEIQIPNEFAKSNIQVGFYYDDYYQWGMGAAIDNVFINADLVTKDLSIPKVDEPSITIINERIFLNFNSGESGSFNWYVYDVSGRLIDSGVNTLLSGQASFNIKDIEPQIVIVKIHFQHMNIVSKIFKN